MFYLKNSCAFTLSKKGKEVNMLKKTKNQIKNQNKGITLIALVITVVLNAYRVVKRRKNFDKI